MIAAGADVPIAGLESVSQWIRDEAAARSLVTEAQVRAAILATDDDPQVAVRALERWGRVQVEKQQNREAVAAYAAEDLQRSPPEELSEAGASDDFMSRIEREAEGAKSEDMRALFGRILAGEIRKPGSFSLATVQLLGVMDHRLAKAVEMARPWVLDAGHIPRLGNLAKGAALSVITQLADLGIARLDMLQNEARYDNQGRLLMTVGAKIIIVVGRPGGPANIPYYPLSVMGRELMRLIDPPSDDDAYRPLVEAMKRAPGANGVFVADIVGREDTLVTWEGVRTL